MATLTVQQMGLTGVAESFTAASGGGDAFTNNGKTYLHVKNTGAITTVTVAAQNTCNYGTLHDSVTSVPATTGDKVIGPFDTYRFNNQNAQCLVTYSQVTGVTVTAVSE